MSQPNEWTIKQPGSPYHENKILLLKPQELRALPKGTVVVSILGDEGHSETADDDTRFGYTAWGKKP
ncbi:MAG TPA: hypothetical protein VNH19_17645 [Candidatus Limnocylindrales bacterium]|nr:hypothetical protein [Candidatus Limnocylindrales bacterium]